MKTNREKRQSILNDVYEHILHRTIWADEEVTEKEVIINNALDQLEMLDRPPQTKRRFRMNLPYECTAYFKGVNHLGQCNSGCQWWSDKGCPCARGHESYDGKESIYNQSPNQEEQS